MTLLHRVVVYGDYSITPGARTRREPSQVSYVSVAKYIP